MFASMVGGDRMMSKRLLKNIARADVQHKYVGSPGVLLALYLV